MGCLGTICINTLQKGAKDDDDDDDDDDNNNNNNNNIFFKRARGLYSICLAQYQFHRDNHVIAETCFTRQNLLHRIVMLSQTRMKGNTSVFQIQWLRQ
jgi:hypothetical protein